MLLAAPGLLLHVTHARVARTLGRLASYAGTPQASVDGLAHLLCALAGVPGDPPIGALLAAGARVSAGTDYWLVADPVTLVAGRADVTLAGRVDDLTPSETGELLTALNAHFHDDGLVFLASRPHVWLARLRVAPALTTTSLERARSAALAQSLPGGADAARWRRWQDEIQMLLHAHPVNAEREARGATPANAIWFSGGGRLSDAQVTTALAVDAPPTRLGDVARGLAFAAPPGHTVTRRTLLVSAPLASSEDADAFVDAKLAPALDALERNAAATLAVVADGGGAAYAWTATRPSWMQRTAARWRPRAFTLPAPDSL